MPGCGWPARICRPACNVLQLQANKSKADPHGRTPLSIAVCGSHFAVVRLLIEEGANRNQADWFGRTPLHEAARQGNVEIVKMMLKVGVDIRKADNFGRTPLDLAVAANHLRAARALLENYSDRDRPTCVLALPQSPLQPPTMCRKAWV